MRVLLAVTTIFGLLLAQAPAPRIHLETRSYESAVFGATRHVRVYLPRAGAGSGPIAGVIVCLWGGDYAEQIGAPETLDALIRAGRIPRLAAVFVDDPDDRFQSFDTTQKIARSLAEELIPWTKTALGLTVDARHTIVAGYSAAGLASAYTAFAYPDVFGNVLSQSGAYWRGFEGADAEPEWIAKHYDAVPPRATRFYLDVGGAETREAGGSGISIKTATEHLRDVLQKKGYALTYNEVPGGQHEYGHWKAAFGPGLVALAADWRAR